LTGYHRGISHGTYASSIDVGNITPNLLTTSGVARHYALMALNTAGESHAVMKSSFEPWAQGRSPEYLEHAMVQHSRGPRNIREDGRWRLMSPVEVATNPHTKDLE
jgi:hypothetical protein